ncbi:hypothetical protein [Pseudoduganella namucuonensis]|uniref:Uncharacterized protein n=1 Tax=Pseudoduganella namucuonensis TaxID=1035707 RepID=A0A1I7LUD0_9BURK|nr:hypothetical protein [Pseudoduganella namucuonensis]SFV13285.1 hypothetical protein SAMN05216552_103818 [Pseudoduganella namucuonensis]
MNVILQGGAARAALRRLAAVFLVALAALGCGHAAAGERLSLDAGRRFLQGDVPLPSITTDGVHANPAMKDGRWTLPVAKGPAWRTLTVPLEARQDQPSGLVGPVLVEAGAP